MRSVLERVGLVAERRSARKRKKARTMARPTAASAAATAMMKKANIWPVMVAACCAVERDERQVHRVQHQLDAHQLDEHVAAHQEADGADA